MSFVYSGNFKGEALKDQFGQTRALLGLQDEMFSYPLETGSVFYTPEVLLSFSGSGMNQLSLESAPLYPDSISAEESIKKVSVRSW